MTRALLTVVFLAACAGTPQATLDTAACDVDADGDGVLSCDDCNDDDPAISPDADEVCDGIDNDCDGRVDDDDTNTRKNSMADFWVDYDRDGFGDPNQPVKSCALQDQMADNDLDCNDDASNIYPGRPEVCDGIDNDCDFMLDHFDPDVVDAESYYEDLDGDGYGSGDPVLSCFYPYDLVDQGGDCDETRTDVNPGVGDDDCDGQNPDCDDVIDGYAASCTGWEITCSDPNDPNCTVITAAITVETYVQMDPLALADWARSPDVVVFYGNGCRTYEVSDSYTATWTVGCAFNLNAGDDFAVEALDVDIGGYQSMGAWTISEDTLIAAAGGGTVAMSANGVEVVLTVQ